MRKRSDGKSQSEKSIPVPIEIVPTVAKSP